MEDFAVCEILGGEAEGCCYSIEVDVVATEFDEEFDEDRDDDSEGDSDDDPVVAFEVSDLK